MKSIKLVLFIILMSTTLVALPNSEKFKIIDCENYIDKTLAEEFLFFQSGYGFVYNTKSVSPLQDEIPEKIGSNTGYPNESISTVLVQAIPTNDLGKLRLEGGTPTIYYVLVILLGVIIGLIVSIFIEQNTMSGLLIGGIVAYFIAMFAFDTYEEDFSFTIDNATDQEYSVRFDNQSDSIVLPEKSQVKVTINEGQRLMQLTNMSTKISTDYHLNATKYKKNDEFFSGYYVCNIDNRNYYSVRFVKYSPE